MKLSSLPRSLSAIRSAVQKSGSGAAIAIGRRASAWQDAQGTRAFPSQGTAANTPNPLVPGGRLDPSRPAGWDNVKQNPVEATFSTETTVRDGTEGTIIQVRDWPPNPSSESLSPSVGHGEQMMTGVALQIGPGPGRIARQVPQRVFGVAMASTGQRGSEVSYGGGNANRDFLAHIPVARQALGVKDPQKLADDNAVIPAVYAGNPR
jgi:hypothetical protein